MSSILMQTSSIIAENSASVLVDSEQSNKIVSEEIAVFSVVDTSKTYTAYRTDSSGNVLGYYEAHTPPPADTATLKFVLCDPADYPAPYIPAPTIEQQISALEATQTPRRIREAANGTDNGWLAALDAKIVALRKKL